MDRQYILEGVHFMRVALAVYGHLLYVADNPFSGPFRLMSRLLRCESSRCNKLAFYEISGYQPEALLYYSVEEGIEKCPYAIVRDEKHRTIVLVLRGSLSLEDVATDLDIRPVAFRHFADRCPVLATIDGYCHAGMIKTSLWVYHSLEKHRILDRMLLEDGAMYADYSLLCTGHSLGKSAWRLAIQTLKHHVVFQGRVAQRL
jgi:sn1-specific diacylglycerol lipase